MFPNLQHMNYSETLHYLYTSVPVFQHDGASAYKPGLDNSIALDNYLKNPHQTYKIIHVAGTNGKGSTSHLLAATLQESGYKVGLYTSPHLVDFRERIRINGVMIPQRCVIDFVEQHRAFFETIHPSFFELTMSMAFDYFRAEKVDVAVIEVGLGGRLDSTNIITPEISIITNISLDHIQFLGNTVEKIATEKAGIIKPHIPVIIGKAEGGVRRVFEEKARKEKAPLFFAEEAKTLIDSHFSAGKTWKYHSADYGIFDGELSGIVQVENTQTVLTAIRILKTKGFSITSKAVHNAFSHVVELTGLMGRWQEIQKTPRIICDTAHNSGGIEYIAAQLRKETYNQLHIVIGMVNDKDINSVLSLLPNTATYYFTRASVPRSLPEEELAAIATKYGLHGKTYPCVQQAINASKENAGNNDLIYVGGSTFIVADMLSEIQS